MQLVPRQKMQSGFVLLFFLVVLIGIGGIVLAGFVQNTKQAITQSRIEKNNRVLQAAKSALLQYAYQYPQIKSNGPGRLPCPDGSNDGNTGALSRALCRSVGRFPWKKQGLNFYDARDADNERLWYAVSSHFYNLGGGSDINSDAYGSITLVDQTGKMIYAGDATLAKGGIAAVIIAPGAALAGQDRQADPLDPANYLDRYHGFDNSRFNNAESDTDDDGFILGPVFDPVQNMNVVNDQFILVTAHEVISVAEKATLQVYRDAIQRYLHNTGDRYPWLFDYDTDNFNVFRGETTTTSHYPNGRLAITGRIPSIFSNYFSDADSAPIETELRLAVSKNYQVSGMSYSLSSDWLSANILTNVRFLDLARRTDDQISLSADNTVEPLAIEDRYYYDRVPFSGTWSECPNGGDELADCNRDEQGVFHTQSNRYESSILRVGIAVDFSGLINFNLDVSRLDTDVDVIYSAADAARHAMVSARFQASEVSGIAATFFYEKGTYHATGIFDIAAADSQHLFDNSDFTDITGQSVGLIEIGLRYYPELPVWAKAEKNNWHCSILMAIAPDYQPGANNSPDCQSNPPCLSIDDIGGVTDDKESLLVLAGQGFDDRDDGMAGFVDDLGEIFDPENADLDTNYLRRQGDDIVLVVR